MALTRALLFFTLFLFVACGTGADTATYVTSTAVNTAASDTAVGDQTTPETGIPGTVTPNAIVGFDCVSVNQIPAVECEALVALYNSTNGPGWDDIAGWGRLRHVPGQESSGQAATSVASTWVTTS